jgi:replicative DNA helicase
MSGVDPDLHPLSAVLSRTDQQLRSDAGPVPLWTTGFDLLDEALGGGMRRGDLVLLAGAQGLGKTTFALQMARGAARAGRHVVYFCFEHDPASLLQRLLTMEAGEVAGPDSPGVEGIRSVVEGRSGDHGSLADRLRSRLGGDEGLSALAGYADRLHLHRSTGTTTSLSVITDVVEDLWNRTGAPPLVFIDYLQKIKVPGVPSEADRVTEVVERLKDLALQAEVPVVAIAASDKEGLDVGHRMRARDLRGSTALAYEADVLLVLSEKYDIVARQHLVYDLNRAEGFRDWVILTIEKNRNGRGGLDLEFRKLFGESRFDPEGQVVSERLIDERVYTE